MKTQLTILLVSLSLIGQAQEKGFVLIGQISGPIPSKKILFAHYDTGKMDSTDINGNQFTFTGKMVHPALATVWTNGIYQGLGVWLSNDTIRATFKIVGNVLQTIEVAGPPQTVDCLNNIKLINTINASSLSKPQKNQQVADLISQYIHNHPDSFYSLFLLSTNSRLLGITQSRALLATLRPALQVSPDADSFKAHLLTQEALAINTVLDAFSLPDTNGVLRRVLPSGKPYTLLALWASWCAPCRAHNRQDLVKLYQRIDHTQIELISISLDNERQAWLNAITKDGMTWPQLSDLNYLSGPLAKKLALYSVPQFILVDNTNKILAVTLNEAIQIIDSK
ncbi:thioredoxin-like domain-containing protein [Spirosoma gilvum]